MTDAMGALHFRHVKAPGHILGQADFLEDLDAVAHAHHLHAGAQMRQGRPRGGDLVHRHLDHGMGGFHQHGDGLTDGVMQRAVQPFEIHLGLRRLNGDLAQTVLCA
jgi:hypothetical protein